MKILRIRKKRRKREKGEGGEEEKALTSFPAPLCESSDDCWMSFNRSADGNQVPDPSKFPDGFKAVADFIHNAGMKSGLYTAKGPHTCQVRSPQT